jgi:hypothetical protein
VSAATVCRDVKWLLAGWSEEIRDRAHLIRARESVELDAMEREAVGHRAQALKLRDAQPLHSRDWERFDRSARSWNAQRLEIKTRRAKLLGLDLEPGQGQQTSNDTVLPITFITMGPVATREELESGDVIDGHFTTHDPSDSNALEVIDGEPSSGER